MKEGNLIPNPEIASKLSFTIQGLGGDNSGCNNCKYAQQFLKKDLKLLESKMTLKDNPEGETGEVIHISSRLICERKKRKEKQ